MTLYLVEFYFIIVIWITEWENMDLVSRYEKFYILISPKTYCIFTDIFQQEQ